MVRWTELANLFSVQSDCPHREKFGYGGDLVASSEMAILNFDMDRFYAKVTQDFVEAARANGGLTETAPYVGISDQSGEDQAAPIDLGAGVGPIDWGLAQPLLVWQLRQYYGDRSPLAEQYEGAKRWIQLLESKAVDNLFDNGISDHESLAPKPRALTGTASYYFNVKLFSQIAQALGRPAEADAAASRAGEIKAAFNRRFLQAGAGRYGAGTQASQAIALYLGLAPAGEQERALQVLVSDIMDGHQGHLTTGIFGTKYMLNALTDAGRADVAYAMVQQRTYPGWGYMLENGASTLWEHWALSDDTYSHDHPMFGSVSEWFYKALAGINPAPEAVGCDRLIIRPQPVGGLKWVKASYDSVRGKIVCDWSREAGQFKLSVRIPVGSSATVFLPARDAKEMAEGGQVIQRAPGVQFVRMEKGRAILAIGSGEYHFTSTLP
jgi:alpha-L-rhamnosidase